MRRTRWIIASLLLVGALALTDRQRQPRPPHQAELLQAGETRVRTLRAGAGDTTLVPLHGYGEHLLTWRGVLDPLAARHRVIAFDLPGFGGSEKPDRPYTLLMMATEVAGFLDRWTRGPVVLVGHSMGGGRSGAIPESVFTKPPSAELRPDQKDSDSLPEYDVLDRILRACVEEYQPLPRIASEQDLPLALVREIVNKVDRNVYKRQQAAPGLKVTTKAFGMGRRFPIAQRFYE